LPSRTPTSCRAAIRPRVDDDLAGSVEDRVHEGSERADLAGGPGERAIEHVEDATKQDHEAADEPQSLGHQDRADDRDAEPDQGERIRRETEAAHPERDRLEDLLDPRPRVVGDGHRGR